MPLAFVTDTAELAVRQSGAWESFVTNGGAGVFVAAFDDTGDFTTVQFWGDGIGEVLHFGGTKDSGFGRTHGEDGLKQFTRPYSFAIGGAPIKMDVATILREMGHYNLATAIMGVVYGTTLRQKWETFSQIFRKEPQETASSNIKSEPVTTK